MAKKLPTERELESARKVLLSHPSVFGQITIMLDEVAPGYLFAALSPHGNGWCSVRHTNRFLRGMIRKALRNETEK